MWATTTVRALTCAGCLAVLGCTSDDDPGGSSSASSAGASDASSTVSGSGASSSMGGSGGAAAGGAGGGTGASATGGSGPCSDSYTTSFDADESPISEGGRWAHDPDNPWQHVRTAGGYARPAAYTEIYDDAYAYLGCWTGGDDYDVIATAFYGGTAAEAEILLRVADSASTVQAYEFLYNTGGSWQFVRWNGPLGDFTVIDGGSTPSGGDGRQVRATIVGSTIDLYWRAGPSDGWEHLATIEEATLPTGKPGMSFYAHEVDQNIDKVGFADWSVTAL